MEQQSLGFAGFLAVGATGGIRMSTTRVASTMVTFVRPFILDGFEQLQPAGSYVVDTEEELIDSLLFPAWKRLSTIIRVSRHGGIEYIPVSPDQLSDALVRDSAQQDPTRPVSASSAKGRRDRARSALALLPLPKRS
jgi:hypothetical protein